MINTLPLFIKDSWKKDLLIGFGLGVLFIFLNILVPAVSFGLPTLPASFGAGRFIVVGVLAPIIENIVFFAIFLTILSYFLKPIFAIPIVAVSFSLFHITAYGGSLLAGSAAFLGAALFAILCAYLAYKRGNQLAGIIVHSMFNIFLISKMAVVIA